MLIGNSDNRKRMRWYGCAIVAIAAQLAWAMPTKDEIRRVEPLMNELMSAYVKGYTANRKSANEVGDAAFHFVKDAQTEAAKYVLLKGAIHYYSLARNFDKVADALEALCAQISDVPPDEVGSIASKALARAGNARALRLRNIQHVASEQAKAMIDISACKKELRKNPGDATALRGLAKAYVRFGDWPRALKVFAKLGIEAAIYECNPEDAKECNALKAADYWWGFSTKNPAPYRAHAAELYRRAINEGLVTGLMKTIVENRIAEVASSGVSMPVISSSTAVPASAPRNGECRKQVLPGGVKMEMIYVAPGSFMMGSSSGRADETPHKVRITKPYWIGKYPVTQAQWKALVRANGVSFANGNPVPYFSREGKGKGIVAGMDTSDFPMEGISWNDCDALVKALNCNVSGGRTYSLPTEAQWEFAAKGGKESRGYTYSGGNDLDALGWYYENSGLRRLLSDSDRKNENRFSIKWRTHSVREKDVGNELGIVGMNGNVWECCTDWYDKDYYAKSPTDDPCNTISGVCRVLRGGGWCDRARNCRSATRHWFNPSVRNDGLGFRLCCSAELREEGLKK